MSLIRFGLASYFHTANIQNILYYKTFRKNNQKKNAALVATFRFSIHLRFADGYSIVIYNTTTTASLAF